MQKSQDRQAIEARFREVMLEIQLGGERLVKQLTAETGKTSAQVFAHVAGKLEAARKSAYNALDSRQTAAPKTTTTAGLGRRAG